MAGPLLHLDAARFGLAPVRVRSALAALAEFGGSEGLSAGLDVLLRGGFSSWPAGRRARYPGLADWAGVGGARPGAFPPAHPQSGGGTDVPREPGLAAHEVGRPGHRGRCRSVLATDLGWPGYLGILGEELSLAGVSLVHLPLLSAVLFDKLSARGVAERVASAYREHGCDGLFLPAASHHGVRMPLGPIRDRLEALRLPPRFFVVDAAQVPGHLPPDPAFRSADLVIAGCHKWLGSLQTLGVGVAPGPRAGGGAVDAITAEARALDPLFDFLEGVRSGRTEPFGETVGLAPLFTARAALAALASRTRSRPGLRKPACERRPRLRGRVERRLDPDLPAPLGPYRDPPTPSPFAGGPADAGRRAEGAVPRDGRCAHRLRRGIRAPLDAGDALAGRAD